MEASATVAMGGEPGVSPAHPRTTSTLMGSATAYYINRVLAAIRVGSLHRFIFVQLEGANLPQMPRGYEMHFIQDNAPELLAAVPSDTVRNWRFSQGCFCVGAYRGDQRTGQLTGLAWMVQPRFKEDEVRAEYLVGENCVWDLGMEVLQDFRGTRAVLAVLSSVLGGMKSRNVSRTISRISDYNTASLSAHGKLGCRKVGSAIFLRIGGLQITFSKMLRHPHISFSDTSRPVFKFA